MLLSLYIENYALIREMDIRFVPGLTVITGETGAGKSIILGALGLILGQRADSSVLQDTKAKCIVEAGFLLKGYQMEGFFLGNDLDFDETTLIRREINAAGKSRAFINDTPVNLNVLKELGDRLVDIHSQHETLSLRDPYFQLEVIDQYACNDHLLEDYTVHHYSWKNTKEQLILLQEKEKQSKLDQDYYQFLFHELEAASLSADEQIILEEELSVLSHAGDIKSGVLNILASLDQSDPSILERLSEIQHILNSLSEFHPQLKDLYERIDTLYIEAKDINRELEQFSEHIQLDPARLSWVQARLDTLYSLQKKHGVNTLSDLLMIRDQLGQKLLDVQSMEEEIKSLIDKEKHEYLELRNLGRELSKARTSAVPGVRKEISELLKQLGMPNATLDIEVRETQNPGPSGFDQVTFLFSANKGSTPSEIYKVASGGELSRLMLAVKSMVSRQKLLPTLIFDEIDMGISGETASRVGQILKQIAEEKQLIVITHLPQIAGRGNQHYYIYKKEGREATTTHYKILQEDERVEEIARMISGDSFSGSTLETARELLGNGN